MVYLNLRYLGDNYTIEIQNNDKIITLKNKILSEIVNDSTIKYIDLNLICHNPIRSFGQQTINNGILSRNWDNMTLDNYPLTHKNLIIEVISVSDYKIEKRKPKKGFLKKRLNFSAPKPKPKKVEFNYDIDFPPLGS
tara:strand:+ start:1795 stop:2205 length:411 start_codon:yes stop_codon:yes gene_type:complete